MHTCSTARTQIDNTEREKMDDTERTYKEHPEDTAIPQGEHTENTPTHTMNTPRAQRWHRGTHTYTTHNTQ